MQRAKVGVIHGRFQPLHLGHMEYLLQGKRRCEFLWIGVTNPDPRMITYEPSAPHRSKPSNNPFTYWERVRMIREALLDEGISLDEFEVVPFPINIPDLIHYYVPLNARFFVTIYDEWGYKKVDVLKSVGIQDIDIMWVRAMSDRVTSGKEIRGLIREDRQWEHLVPKAVARIIKEIGISTIVDRMVSKDE